MKITRSLSLLFGILFITSSTQANLIDLLREEDVGKGIPDILHELLEPDIFPDELGGLPIGEGLPPGLWSGPEHEWLLIDLDCDLDALVSDLLFGLDPLIDSHNLSKVDLAVLLETFHEVLQDVHVPGSDCPPLPTGSAIPEPSTYGVLGAAAMLGLILLRRIKKVRTV